MHVPTWLFLIAMNQSVSHSPDLLGLYLDEAGSFPLLTKADEMRLGQIIQEGQSAQATLDSGDFEQSMARRPRVQSHRARDSSSTGCAPGGRSQGRAIQAREIQARETASVE